MAHRVPRQPASGGDLQGVQESDTCGRLRLKCGMGLVQSWQIRSRPGCPAVNFAPFAGGKAGDVDAADGGADEAQSWKADTRRHEANLAVFAFA